MLISREYQQLNAILHDTNANYGTSGQRFADYVQKLCKKLDTQEVLDYGAGKKTLEKALGFEIQNYDPCIPSLSALPVPSYVVVCTEVMEHIEPDLLDDVLNHLMHVTKGFIFLSVATRAASKTLPDGRNTHLIVQPYEWWEKKLEKYFRMLRSFDVEGGFVYIGQSYNDSEDAPNFDDIGPPVNTKRLILRSVYTDEQRAANIRSSMLRRLPSVPILPPHYNTMIVCGYGPSLKSEWRRIKKMKGDVYTTSGAHDFLIERGIIPKGHVEVDPRPHKALNITPHKDVCYFLTSVCAKETFDKVNDYETWIFHTQASKQELLTIRSFMGNEEFTVINTGTTSGSAMIGLGGVLGYKKFEVIGIDCSFEMDDKFLHWPVDEVIPAHLSEQVEFHAGKHFNENQELYRVWLGNRPFVTSPQMAQNAQDFLHYISQHKYNIRFHGDGFLKNLVEHIKIQKGGLRVPQIGEFAWT